MEEDGALAEARRLRIIETLDGAIERCRRRRLPLSVAARELLPLSCTLLGAEGALVRALDDAIEASLPYYPSPVSAQVMAMKRKIGVGVCGLADLLLAAGVPYCSPNGSAAPASGPGPTPGARDGLPCLSA